jgi:hypothetical protein
MVILIEYSRFFSMFLNKIYYFPEGGNIWIINPGIGRFMDNG